MGKLSVLGSALLFTGASLLEYAIGLLTSIVIARSLGPEHFGLYSFSVWLAGTLFFFGNHGTSITAIRFVAEANGAQEHEKARAEGAWLGQIQQWSSAATILVFGVFAWLFRPDYWGVELAGFVVLISVAVIAKGRYSYLHSLALGQHKFWISAVAPVAAALTYLITSVLLVRQSHDTIVVYGAYVLSTIVGYLVVSILLRRSRISPLRGPLPADLKLQIRNHLLLSAMLAFLGHGSNRVIETFVLSTVGSRSEIAFFAIAGTLTKGAVDILTSGLQATLMPVMAHARGRDGLAGTHAIVNSALRYYWFVGLIIAGAGVVGTRSLIHIVYGDPYLPAVLPVQLTMLGAGLALVLSVTTAFQSTTDKQANNVKATAMTIGFNLLLALTLVPWFGLLGAAVTFATVRVFLATVSFVLFARSSSLRVEYAPCLRLLLAALVSFAVSFGVYYELPIHWGGFVAAPLMVFLMVAMSILFRSWKRTDFDIMMAVARRLLPRHQRVHAAFERLRGRFSADF